MRNLIFVAFVEPVADGAVFLRTDWPLHITLVRFDAGSRDSPDPTKRVADLAGGPAEAALGAHLLVGEDAAFGRNGSVAVSLVKPHPALQALHEALVEAATAADGRILTPRHTMSGYRPHVSHHATREGTVKRLNPGDAVVLDRIALVDMAPDGDHTVRHVLRLWSRTPEAG
ncbi:2'-5' RNA ligase family protein [Pseudarthrobacter sp. NamE2]|uniref:2'-5' RNA ligase family protein n=1 Tax=Pseudarthrobacter sp. NamE2 TaxID=2576838 RepID=UPI0010FE8F45|nr:2'-5' RNA ligase family protein [Pseudarthrobacter sp. NamE2]TLM81415.1 2'-5' RNA ligase family protein [Pseudarthrobacter sp. NamE2]